MEFKPRDLSSSLEIKDLIVSARLGCSAEERAVAQDVLLSFKIQFLALPKACTSDDLLDTHCYDQLSQKIRSFANSREFKLIEFLGHEIFHLVQTEVGTEKRVSIRLAKAAPVEGLKGAAIFSVGDI